MSTWNVEGQSADLTQSEAQYVLALLNNVSNWTENTVGFANITFATGWYIDNKDYMVVCKNTGGIDMKPYNLGATRYEFKAYVQIHVWARKLGLDIGEVAPIDAMKRQINQIIGQNRTGAGAGIRFVQMMRWVSNLGVDPHATGDTPYHTLLHHMGTCKVWYGIVSTI